jgi:hypothetical protein
MRLGVLLILLGLAFSCCGAPAPSPGPELPPVGYEDAGLKAPDYRVEWLDAGAD